MAKETTESKLTSAQQNVMTYLKAYAEEDETFEKKIQNDEKTFEKCWEYITKKAQKQAQNGCACIEDDEVYNWATHYYDEDNEVIEKEVGIAPAPKATVTTSAPTKAPKVTSTRKVSVPKGGIKISLFK